MESHTQGLVLGVGVLTVFLVGTMLSVAEGLGSTAKDKATADSLTAIVPLKLEERMAAHRKLLEERTQTVGELLLLVNELKNSPERTLQNGRLCFAIRMLGDIRAAEATQPLLDLIDTRFPGFSSDTGAPKDPEIIEALVNIGKPASRGAVEMLATDKSSKRALMYVRVIVLVEGADVGKYMVRLAADKEKDPDKKTRLQTALGLFDKASEPIP
jgi:hypothetical protein